MLTVEPERRDAGDEIVRRIVAPLISRTRTGEECRFGFNRRVESAHPAVHLHLRAPEDVVKGLWKSVYALADESAATLGAVKISQWPDISYPPRSGEPVHQVMETAFSRFGGPKGLELVAGISELSSDLALWAVNRFPGPNTRSMLAALLLFDTGHAMMRGPRSAVWPDRRTISWDYYWNVHLHTCKGPSASQSEPARRAMMDQMAPRVMPAHRVMAALATEPAVDLWRKRWVRAIDEYLYRADKQRISRSAQQLAMGASQLTLNRLGFPLREQGVFGLYARAWSKDIEAQYSGEGRSSQLAKQ
nr:lantibiotic dehydratase C-terminal domain-containing protein [Arthrobacter jiangjiafuii]